MLTCDYIVGWKQFAYRECIFVICLVWMNMYQLGLVVFLVVLGEYVTATVNT